MHCKGWWESERIVDVVDAPIYCLFVRPCFCLGVICTIRLVLRRDLSPTLSLNLLSTVTSFQSLQSLPPYERVGLVCSSKREGKKTVMPHGIGPQWVGEDTRSLIFIIPLLFLFFWILWLSAQILALVPCFIFSGLLKPLWYEFIWKNMFQEEWQRKTCREARILERKIDPCQQQPLCCSFLKFWNYFTSKRVYASPMLSFLITSRRSQCISHVRLFLVTHIEQPSSVLGNRMLGCT